MMNKKNKLNIIQILFSLGFSVLFIRLIINRDIEYYVHPRIVPYLIFASGVLLVVAVVQIIAEVRSKGFKMKASLSYTLFLMPLLTGFLLPVRLPEVSLATGLLAQNQARMNEDTTIPTEDLIPIDSDRDSNEEQALEYEKNNPTTDPLPTDAATDPLETPLPSKTKGELVDGAIVMDNSNSLFWMDEIYVNMENYENVSITMEGFVYFDDTLSETEFVAARHVMTCCAADLQIAGLLCHYEEVSSLAKDSWVRVTGIIQLDTYQGQAFPLIQVEIIEPIVEPEDEILYP